MALHMMVEWGSILPIQNAEKLPTAEILLLDTLFIQLQSEEFSPPSSTLEHFEIDIAKNAL